MLEATIAEQDRVAKRIKTCRAQTMTDLIRVISMIQGVSERLKAQENAAPDAMEVDSGGEREKGVVVDMELDGDRDGSPSSSQLTLQGELLLLQKRVKPLWTKMTANHKEGYAAISKLGKTVDKVFQANLEKVCNPEAFEGKETLLHQVIVHHLLRQGNFAIADTLVKEANVDIGLEEQEPLRDMFCVLEAIKKKDLVPALQWVDKHQQKLLALGSNLEFLLHRLQFIGQIVNEDRSKALAYACAHFPKFATRHLKDIQHLMGMFAYLGRLETSPYRDLLGPSHWTDIAQTFTTTCWQALGLPTQSPLHVGVTVGTQALPTVLKMANVMQNKKEGLWSQKDELPVEIYLSKDNQYHSVFTCPVSREQTTDDNPPMLLLCGHVIAKMSLQKLSKGNKFKCPYCPSEQTPLQALEIHI